MSKSFYSLFLIFFFFTTSCFGQVIPNYIPKNGLVGWWPFNGNANDESGNGNNGIVNGATLTKDRNDNLNSSYQFNGINQFINLGTAGIDSIPINFSVSTWVFIDSLYKGNYGATSVILSKRHTDWGPSWTTLYVDSLYNAAISIDGPGYNNNLISNFNLKGSWQHIVGVKAGNNYSLYINGILVESKIDNYQHSGSNLDMYIGHHGAWNTFFYGKIDDIGTWNRALNNQEVKSLYTQNYTYIKNSDISICKGNSVSLNIGLINAQNLTDVEGNNYPILNIGNQTWTQQNLSVSKYRNGDIIPQVTDPNQWIGLTTGAWCWYNNDSVNYSSYGKLYNWYAIKDSRGITPNGWHIPTGLEWDNLAMFVSNGNENAGGHLKEAGTKHWAQPNTDATNSSGFNGLPGGYRANQDASGTFREIGNDGWFFYDADSLAGFKNIYYNNSAINAVNQFGTYNYFSKVTGASVRLIKDTFLITASLPKYLWSTGDTTASINVTPTSTTTYYCSITIDNQVVKDSVKITVNSIPQINAGPDQTLYSGDSLTLTATGASTYSWNNGVLNGVSFIPTSTLNYTVEGVDSNGCKGVDSVLISVVPKPKLPSYLPTNGLVGWWPFNGNANDESGNLNHGTVNGAILTADRNGLVNSAYNFDGNNFTRISIPNAPNLNLTNDFTISSWINGVSFNSAAVRMIISKSGDNVGSQNGYNYGIWGDESLTNNNIGSINFQAQPFNNSSTYPNGNSGLIEINNWYNYVVTYSKSTSVLKYYINNVLVDTKNLAFNIEVNTNELWIGSQASVYNTIKTFNGKIDDIAIYNRPLSQIEIDNLYKGDCILKIKIDSTRTSLSCLNDSIKLTTISVLNGQYQWYKNGQQIINAIDTSYLVKEIGTYSIKVTSGLCSSTDSILIKPISPIKVNAGPDQTVCAGQAITLKANGADNYSWNNGITDGISFVPKNSSIYTVVGKDLDGCEGIDTVNISIVGNNVNLKIYSGSEGTSCNGIAMVSTQYSSDFSIHWSNGQVSATSNDTCFNLCSGPMSVVINDKTNKCNFSFSGIIINKTIPLPLSSYIKISNISKNVLCNGSSTIIAFGGKSPYNYSLKNNKGLLLNNLNKADSLCPGIYKYKITDSKNDSIFNTFLISDSSSTISNVNPIFKDSLIIDTLIVNAIENCIVDLKTIDSVWINSYLFKGLDSLSVIWNIKDTNSIYSIEVIYNVPNCQGVFNLELSLYCPTKSSNLPFKKFYNQLFVSSKQASINEIKTENFKIFPNPFNEFLLINFNGNELTNYNLVDAIGRIVLSGNVKTGENIIYTELIPKGIYFLKLGENYSSTIVKI